MDDDVLKKDSLASAFHQTDTHGPLIRRLLAHSTIGCPRRPPVLDESLGTTLRRVWEK